MGFKEILAVGLIGIVSGCATSVEQAGYRVLSEAGKFELRDYSPQVVAETVVDGSMEDAGNKAFRRLFGYISGKNRSQTRIEMTAPVTQEPASGPGRTAAGSRWLGGLVRDACGVFPGRPASTRGPTGCSPTDPGRQNGCRALLRHLEREALPSVRRRTERVDREDGLQQSG